MPDVYVAGKTGLIEPANGAYVNTWDTPLAANWITIDAAVSGTTTVSLSNLNVVLVRPTYPTSPNPAGVANAVQNLRLLLTGTLSANVAVSIPSGVPGMWLVDNQTTGSAYTVTVNTSAGGSTGVTPPRGYLSYIFSDGTNVRYADGGGIISNVSSVPTGTILSFGGTSAPSGYLFCDGSVVSQAAYAALYAAIGTTWNTGGEGAGNFRLPDLQNMFLRGSGTSAVGVSELDEIKQHTHSVTDPGHAHASQYNNQTQGYPPDQSGIQDIYNVGTNWTYPTTSNTTGISIQSTGGTETRPVNKRVLYIIKT